MMGHTNKQTYFFDIKLFEKIVQLFVSDLTFGSESGNITQMDQINPYWD